MTDRINSISRPDVTSEILDRAIQNACQQVRINLPEFTSRFKGSNSKNNFYSPTENVEWTTGFWTGEIWLAFENTGDQLFREAAEVQVESFLHRIERKIDVNHHDMGFLYSLSCVASYKLTRNGTARKAALLAADNLMSRYQEKGNFFQAWGDLNDRDNYRLIIDCLLNLPLLYWASETTGKSEYADRAKRHIATAMRCIIRPDDSTYHTYYFDPETGEPVRGVTHQGNRDGSAWARGQAWGIYGVALSYRYVRDSSYISVFKRLADYFIRQLPEDLIPYWDFDFGGTSEEPRDSSAAAIAACGMLEMARHLEINESCYYTNVARKIIFALIEKCSVRDPLVSNGQILHGTYARQSAANTCRNIGVDECNTWGDYFYFEALTRLSKDWNTYW